MFSVQSVFKQCFRFQIKSKPRYIYIYNHDTILMLNLIFNLRLNSNPPFFLCLNTSFVFPNYQPRQWNASCNRAIIVDWSLSGMMTSKLVIHESESPLAAASSISISQFTSTPVIIPHRTFFLFVCWGFNVTFKHLRSYHSGTLCCYTGMPE